MKSNKILGDVLELKDLAKSKLAVIHVNKINELKDNHSITRVNEVGVFVGNGKAHFLSIADPTKPEIMGSVALIQDDMYANQFLGFRDNHALFSIAYQGVEIVDVADLSAPRSLGLNKNYGIAPYKMMFVNNLGITSTSILDLSDIFNPRLIKDFNGPTNDYLLHNGNLVYISSREYVETMSLEVSSNYKDLATLRCPFSYGFSKLEMLDKNILFGASGNGIAVAEISERADSLELKALVNLDIIPENLVITENLCITRTIRNPDDMIVCLNLSNIGNPSLDYSLFFDNQDLWYFMANRKFLICLCTAGLERQIPKKTILILTNSGGAPEIVGEIKIDLSSGFELIDNCVYEFTKAGMHIYEIN